MPGDLLISRIVKELDKRFMHVTDLMKIKGVIWERQSESKKEKVGENLYSERTPDQQDEERTETVRNYLDVIEMYMLGLSIAGAKALEPAPTAPEDSSTDPSDYVIFPYQFALDYHGRAQAFTQDALKAHTPAMVYEMLKERDREERTKWVEKIRLEGTRTIGKIFKEVYESRREVWRFQAVQASSTQNQGGDNSGEAAQGAGGGA